ncbi:MAG: zinc dependent phospholipase C family protein [Lachnospiraceae bacterium]|nr:zinc dependent phospholipase C family protein [Lachnospiraceae bacterium]
MPGFDTHYIFGKESYKKIDSKYIRRIIRNNHTVYGLGLQGPDIFFYDLIGHLKRDLDLGDLAHDHRVSDFLFYLRDAVKIFPEESDKEIAEVYFLGFLGHHTLDSTAHPYIYAVTDYDPYVKQKGYFDKHLKLETDINTVMLKKYKGLNPSQFRQLRTIELDKDQLEIVATQLLYAYNNTWPELGIKKERIVRAILSFQFNVGLLHDPRGEKKRFLATLEQFVPGHMLFSGIIARNRFIYNEDPCNLRHLSWSSPWEPEIVRNESFINLFNKAERKYLKLISLSSKLFLSPSDLADEEKENAELALFDAIGNVSYLSGLDSYE